MFNVYLILRRKKILFLSNCHKCNNSLCSHIVLNEMNEMNILTCEWLKKLKACMCWIKL